MLLDAGLDVNAQNKSGATAMCLAAEKGHADVLDLLLKNGGDAEGKAGRGDKTPLFLACRSYKLEAVQVLLSHGADCFAGTVPMSEEPCPATIVQRDMDAVLFDTIRCFRFSGPLHIAAAHGFEETCRWVLSTGRDGGSPQLRRSLAEGEFADHPACARLVRCALRPWAPAYHKLFGPVFRENVAVLMMVYERLVSKAIGIAETATAESGGEEACAVEEVGNEGDVACAATPLSTSVSAPGDAAGGEARESPPGTSAQEEAEDINQP